MGLRCVAFGGWGCVVRIYPRWDWRFFGFAVSDYVTPDGEFMDAWNLALIYDWIELGWQGHCMGFGTDLHMGMGEG